MKTCQNIVKQRRIIEAYDRAVSLDRDLGALKKWHASLCIKGKFKSAGHDWPTCHGFSYSAPSGMNGMWKWMISMPHNSLENKAIRAWHAALGAVIKNWIAKNDAEIKRLCKAISK